MIKFTGTRGDRPYLVLCLEAGNLERLKEGPPIAVDGAKLGLPMDVVIDYAPTQEAMLEKLRATGLEIPPVDQWKQDPDGERS